MDQVPPPPPCQPTPSSISKAPPPPPPPPMYRVPTPPAPPPPPRAPGSGPCKWRRGVKKSNLEPLHWNKVTRALPGSLWEEFLRQNPSGLDVSEIETLFSNAPPKNGAPKDVDKKKASCSCSKPEKGLLINWRRVRSTELMLTKVLQLPVMLIDAVLAMDDTLLDVKQVENVLKCFPTKEEMELLKNYTGNIGSLSRCEQFFVELMMVPRMEAKLNAFLFKIQFDHKIADLKKSLDVVNSACDEVRTSARLREIMKRLLYLGNTLNQGTATGAAVGFKLDSLLRLTDARVSNSKMTLMHYLCKLIAAKSPLLLEFGEDLKSLEDATKIQLRSLAEEMQTLILEMQKVKKELDACANDGPISKGFHTTLKAFIGNAEADVTNLNAFYSIVGKNADGLSLYFGEDPARCPFEQATQVLQNFVRRFQKCHEDNLKSAELERKDTEREAEMEQAKGANLPIQIIGTVE